MMEHSHLLLLVLLLIVLITGSAFFSGAETGMMAINRYRLRHLARRKDSRAVRVTQLLKRPDRLLGVILICNTFTNILASSVATVLAIRFWGDLGVAIATVCVTFLILIFGEIMPKTIGVLYPERIAFFASLTLKTLQKLLYPIIYICNGIVNGLLRIFGVQVTPKEVEHLTHEELRTLVHEASGKIGPRYRQMLLRILDLEKETVEDIMVPRKAIIGINLEDSWDSIVQQLQSVQHTWLPVYHGEIDQVHGMIHMRKALNVCAQQRLSKAALLEAAEEVYFIPESTRLDAQLVNFQKVRKRIGLVVDEYGDIQGLATLEDILEEIVGQFTTDLATVTREIWEQKDGSFLVGGTINLRELNRSLGWELPVTGPKTLAGLIIEYLEMIPTAGVGLRIAGYPIEIIEVHENNVKLVRVFPKLRKKEIEPEVSSEG